MVSSVLSKQSKLFRFKPIITGSFCHSTTQPQLNVGQMLSFSSISCQFLLAIVKGILKNHTPNVVLQDLAGSWRGDNFV